MSNSIRNLTINSIQEKISELNLVNKALTQIIDNIAENTYEEIFIKYIELQNASDVAIYFNDIGKRIPSHTGERKYISNDITQLISNPFQSEFGRREIYEFAKLLYSFHKGKNTWNSVVKFCSKLCI